MYLGDKSVYGSAGARRELQSRLSIVFQDYTSSVNPRFRISDILKEGLAVAQRRRTERLNVEEEIPRLLELVGLSAAYAGRFPHELSGGQLQRVCIARAVACRPHMIVFDEAISSLDAHTQVQIMDLLIELKDRLQLSYVFITHDLTAITYLCDRVVFLHQGRITEDIAVDRIAQSQDLYARRLLESIIILEEEAME